ncbi:hypothetical protein D3C85_1580700 [compost metagenome]
MGPERNCGGGQCCSEGRKRANPFTLCAKGILRGPRFPHKHSDARYHAHESCYSKDNFRTAEFGHVASVRVERESYSIENGVSV